MPNDPDNPVPAEQDGAGLALGTRNFCIDKEFFHLLGALHPQGGKLITNAIIPQYQWKTKFFHIKKCTCLSTRYGYGQAFIFDGGKRQFLSGFLY